MIFYAVLQYGIVHCILFVYSPCFNPFTFTTDIVLWYMLDCSSGEEVATILSLNIEG